MGECKCCNDLGSSPKYQLFLTICIAFFLIPLGVYGISIINFTVAECEDTECWDAADDFYRTSEAVAYYAGFFVSIICLVTCIARCCAPCCCQLSDVPCPCPCTSFGMLDLCFYIGFVVAIYPVNLYFTINTQCQVELEWPQTPPPLCDTWYDPGAMQLADVVLCLGILLLCVAIPLGCIKFKRMQEKGGESTSPQQVPQVVGTAVVVNQEPV